MSEVAKTPILEGINLIETTLKTNEEEQKAIGSIVEQLKKKVIEIYGDRNSIPYSEFYPLCKMMELFIRKYEDYNISNSTSKYLQRIRVLAYTKATADPSMDIKACFIPI